MSYRIPGSITHRCSHQAKEECFGMPRFNQVIECQGTFGDCSKKDLYTVEDEKVVLRMPFIFYKNIIEIMNIKLLEISAKLKKKQLKKTLRKFGIRRLKILELSYSMLCITRYSFSLISFLFITQSLSNL